MSKNLTASERKLNEIINKLSLIAQTPQDYKRLIKKSITQLTEAHEYLNYQIKRGSEYAYYMGKKFSAESVYIIEETIERLNTYYKSLPNQQTL